KSGHSSSVPLIHSSSETRRPILQWLSLVAGVVKLNVDVVVSAEGVGYGIGLVVVARYVTKECGFSASLFTQGSISNEVAEAFAILIFEWVEAG
uniref:Uncharacterized protein n=1 Tax=Cucumis melo TaxID=3656 RepID=A0A9I9D5H2_CUCME